MILPRHRLLPRVQPEAALQRSPTTTVLAILRRELASYFDSPLAYIVVPAFLLLVGGFSLGFNDILAAGLASMRTVFFWCAVFYLLLIPAVTMRLFAEERRTGSIEMLVTMPITETEMVLGKYLAALSLMTLALALTVTYPLTLASLGNLDWGPVVGGYLGLFLLGASFCAIGTAASALTHNQIVAFLVSLIVCLVPFATGFALAKVPPALLPLVQDISFQTHFNNLARGVIDTRSLVFYLSVCALFLHIAVFSLQRRRLS
ncbi:MAG: ABC transporter permease subunit [Oligoflexia bacterium]|nr:ABC transporter permease subunit [Oligoflexia bacterium]